MQKSNGQYKVAAAAVLVLTLLAVIAAFSFEKGRRDRQPPENAWRVVDNFNSQGEPQKIYLKKEPKRIIGVWQNSTETVLALGKGKAMVASFGIPFPECLRPEYREAYGQIPHRQMQIMDMEHLLLLEPDLIIGWFSTFSNRYTRTTDFWNARGVATYLSETSMGARHSRTLEDELSYVLGVGKAIGREREAEHIVREVRAELDFVKRRTAERKKKRVLILEETRDNFQVYAKDTLAGNMLTTLGGELIDLKDSIGYEDIVMADPDFVILIVSEDRYAQAELVKAQFLEKEGLRSVTAVRENAVVVLPLYMVYSAGTRVYDGIHAMAEAMYPEIYQDAGTR